MTMNNKIKSIDMDLLDDLNDNIENYSADI